MSDAPNKAGLDNFIKVEPLRDEAQLAALKEAAAEDQHPVLFPTHIFRKRGRIVGYCSLGTALHWWMHSRNCHSRDTIQAISIIEALMRDRGHAEYVMLCAHNSPYFEYLERVGFEKLGNTVAFRRQL